MEVSWYLRFAKTDKIVALVDKGTEPQLYHQLEILPDWKLAIEEEANHAKATFTRIIPVFDK